MVALSAHGFFHGPVESSRNVEAGSSPWSSALLDTKAQLEKRLAA